MEGNDPKEYYKLFKLYDHVQKNCRDIPPEENNFKGEQIIPYNDASGLKQYNPAKPSPWGFKMLTRCTDYGLINDFFLLSLLSIFAYWTPRLYVMFYGNSLAAKLICL